MATIIDVIAMAEPGVRLPGLASPRRAGRAPHARARTIAARAARPRSGRTRRRRSRSDPESRPTAEIVITEFMDEQAVREAFAGRDVLYDPKPSDRARRR